MSYNRDMSQIKVGWVLAATDRSKFFLTYIKGKLETTHIVSDAWFTEDDLLADDVTAELERGGYNFYPQRYWHGSNHD
jgi:hypothetical protein